MVALFCILRGCGQEVYGKVHKTLGVFSEKGAIEMEGVRLCRKPPTESPGSHFNPGHKGKRSVTSLLPSLPLLCMLLREEPKPQSLHLRLLLAKRSHHPACTLWGHKEAFLSLSDFRGDLFLCLMALSLTCPPASGVGSRDLERWSNEVLRPAFERNVGNEPGCGFLGGMGFWRLWYFCKHAISFNSRRKIEESGSPK